MCQDSAYIKGMTLGFLANWFLWKISLSLPSPYLLSSFSSVPHPRVGPPLFHMPKDSVLWLQEWRSRRRRRRLLIKELILQSRSRCWSKCSSLKFFLGGRVFYEEKSVRDWSRWTLVEVGHVCGLSVYESMIIKSGEYLSTPR